MATRHWINNSFRVARSMHSNFYENRDPEDDVLAGLILCEELSERLYQLFGPGGRSPYPLAWRRPAIMPVPQPQRFALRHSQ